MAPAQRRIGRLPPLIVIAGILGIVIWLRGCTHEKRRALAWLAEVDATWRGDGPTLSIGLDGCWELEDSAAERELICWLDPLQEPESQQVRIIVRGQKDAELTMDGSGCEATPCTESSIHSPEPLRAGRCLDLRRSRARSCQEVRLRLSAEGQTLGERKIRFALPPRTAVDDLRVDWQAAAAAGLVGLEALIPRARALVSAQAPGTLRDRAQIVMSLLIQERNQLYEDAHGPLADAEAAASRLLLEQALRSARSQRWLRSEAQLSQALVWGYTHSGLPPRAEETLEGLLSDRQWLPLLPTEKFHCYRQLLYVALERQDLRRVSRYMAEVRDDVELLNGQQLLELSELRAAELELLLLTGSLPEVEKRLRADEESVAHTAGPCDQHAKLWGQIGWLRLLQSEIGWPNAKDPVPALEHAKTLRASSSRCTTARALANVWANLARARSVAWWRWAELSPADRDEAVQRTRTALAEVSRALARQPEPASIRLDRLYSETRLKLMEGSPAEALLKLDEFDQLAAGKKGPIDRWLIPVHRAEALSASGRIKESVAEFRRAEQQLPALLRQIPIYQARHLILSRFEYSHQRAIELAVRTGRPADAMEILRLFNQQALGSTHVPWWQEQMNQANSTIWHQRSQEQARYLTLRTEYEKQISLAWGFTAAQCQDLNLIKTRSLESLDALFTNPTPALLPPPPIPTGELLLGCARQHKGWICLGALDGIHKAVPVLSPELDSGAVGQIVLPAFADEIWRATRIRILAHGRLAQLDLCAIKLAGTPLGTQKPIYYSVDRPAAKTEPRAPKTALLVLRPEVAPIPELSLPAAKTWLAPALRDLRVTLRSTESVTTPLHWTRGEALSPDVFADLQRSDVFIYFGHVAPMPCPLNTVCCTEEGGLHPDERLTALQLAQDTSLSTADVLLAKRVPQRAFLLGCASTDRSTSTSAEIVGLAQAFALRGAQALGFARQRMDARTAAEVLCALGQQRLDAPDFDLGNFLVDTQRRLYRGERCKAQGKWYSCRQGDRTCSSKINWEALRWYGP